MEGGLLASGGGLAPLRLSLAALNEVLGAEEPAKLLIELAKRRRFRLIDREVRGLQRSLNAERPRGADFSGQSDPCFQPLGAVGSDLLDTAHPIGLFGTPVVAGQHVAHGV